ncbi:MAG: pantoate--beta-alanine ligase [Saprospiraceae bacterium]|nr:pantoate--beta-alanine ligase [Saprospiraceae bacterium]
MILVIDNTKDLRTWINFNKKKDATIGFVPTMGSLHEGHITLTQKSKKQNTFTIVSIFVNPTQFNHKQDLIKYPRTLGADLEMLKPTGVDIVFAPSVFEIYPKGNHYGADINLGGLDKYMEGAFRPGHFKGVAQVVKRLLEIVTPDRLYMGQKDFQQFTIINYMLKNLKINTKLIVCPIIRESNGLAMSSRNVRLSPETKEKASVIYKTLKAVKKYQHTKSITELCQYGIKKLSVKPFKPEYLTIVDGHTLHPITDINNSTYAVACLAVWADDVRLIDNIILKNEI